MRELLRQQCCCGDNGNAILRIPYGNDFRLGICHNKVAPGSKDVTFADIIDLKACLTTRNAKIQLEYETTENGDLLLKVLASSLSLTTYGLLMTGTYGGHAWRWNKNTIFCIVENNNESNVKFTETFDEDTYWVEDALDAVVADNDEDGETLIIVTHGMVTIDDGVVNVVSDNMFLK